jgi:hypothetical protein
MMSQSKLQGSRWQLITAGVLLAAWTLLLLLMAVSG